LLLSYGSSLQAIIRGLKESGVFTSAVTSAKGHSEMKSLDKGLGNKDSIRLNVTTGQSTLGGGRSDTLQASARKILEMVEKQEEAMPPLSPPGFV
jgi:ribosome assembly protein YihI (activator of Der GTPase)